MFTNYERSKVTSPSSVKDLLIDYGRGYPSAKTKPEIGDGLLESGHSCWQYVFKLIVVMACTLGCGYQCISILNMFFSFPSIVFVYVETMDQLQLPGVTLCNSNR